MSSIFLWSTRLVLNFNGTRLPFTITPTNVSSSKQFITAIDLKDCGCIDETPENIEKIKCCAYDVYCEHYAPCDTSCNENLGGYKIFHETGVMQFDKIGKFKKVYIEYRGFMPKKNGQYQIPEVAFETIVEWIKFRAVDGKRWPAVDKQWRYEQYRIARKNMNKEMGAIDLGQILQTIGMVPKFDIDYTVFDPVDCGTSATTSVITIAQEETCSVTTTACPPASATKVFTPFGISQVAGLGGGAPVSGTNVYQDNKLKSALNVTMIVVNNIPETIAANQFVLDTVAGTITRYQGDGVTPNNWADGDVLIVPTFFKLV